MFLFSDGRSRQFIGSTPFKVEKIIQIDFAARKIEGLRMVGGSQETHEEQGEERKKERQRERWKEIETEASV